MATCCSGQDKTFDLAVVGAGSAGFSAAITAAEDGARVALIGHGTMGGTCVNVGCVPSKTMIRAAEVLHAGDAADRFDGIEAAAHLINWRAVVRQKQALVDELRAEKYVDVLPNYNGIAYLEGEARFGADGKLALNGAPVDAGKIVIATGARPRVPRLESLSQVRHHDSTSILDLGALPKSLMVMGGGYIGVELAQVFARAGVKVTMLTRRGLLPDAEPEISAALTGYFQDEKIAVRKVRRYNEAAQSEGRIALLVETEAGEATIEADELLLATGRAPNVEVLDVPSGGVKTNSSGGIAVDDKMRTSREGIYAAGDVTGYDQFVYMAAYGARLAAKNALNGDRLTYDNTAMPAVVFCDPQVASVGLTEVAAIAAGHAVRTSVLPLAYVPRALAARNTRGLIKLVAERASKRLLGAHILAPEGADSIQTAVMALKAGLTYEDLGATIFPYLTTVEGLKLAAQAFDKDVARLSCCAG